MIRSSYIPQLDGLRAIAVLSVVLYHLNLGLGGGYLGVDIFFVISGYIISKLILDNIRRGGFSFLSFYVGRVNRIIPMVLFVNLTVFLFGFKLLPHEFKDILESQLYAISFIANYYFYLNVDYFKSLDSNPLIHLWSLAVEEQFYIFWPFIILFLKSHYRWVILLILFFIVVIYTAGHDQALAFYSPWSRGVEFMLGGFVAYLQYKFDRFYIKSNFVFIISSIIVLYFLVFFKYDSSFSGYVPALFSLVVSLVILSFGSSVGAFLGNQFLVFIGKRLYSIYMNHWVLIWISSTSYLNFGWYFNLLLIFCFSELTYRFIENPFRYGKVIKKPSVRAFFLLFLSFVLFTGVFYVYKNNAFPDRFSSVFNEVSDAKNRTEAEFRPHKCFLYQNESPELFSQCSQIGDSDRKILLWGDSFAADLVPGLAKGLSNFTIVQRTAAECPPYEGSSVHINKTNCKSQFEYIKNEIAALNLNAVILSSLWSYYPNDLANVEKTIIELNKNDLDFIFLFGHQPTWNPWLPNQLKSQYDLTETIPRKMTRGFSLHLDLDLKLAEIANKYENVFFYSPSDAFCDESSCKTLVGFDDATNLTSENLTTWDFGHLTSKGSEFLIKDFLNKFGHLF